MNRKQFLSTLCIIPFCSLSDEKKEKLITTIQLIKDASVRIDYLEGCCIIDIYGKDANDKFWHWRFKHPTYSYYKDNQQVFENSELKQLVPDQNKEILKFDFDIRLNYKNSFVNIGNRGKLSIKEEIVEKQSVEVKVIYK